MFKEVKEIDKTLIKSTEDYLKSMYRKDRTLSILKREYEEIKDYQEKIKRDIEETNISIDAEKNLGFNYRVERVKISNSEGNSIDKMFINAITHLENNLKEAQKKKLETNIRIRNLESELIGFKKIIDLLDECDRRIIEARYMNEISFPKLAIKLNMAEPNIYICRKKILEKVYSLLIEHQVQINS